MPKRSERELYQGQLHTSRPATPMKFLSIVGYKKLVKEVVDVYSNTSLVLLALLEEARSEGTTPHLEAKGLFPPTDFSWELMMKIIED